MEFTGKFDSASKDYVSGKMKIVFSVDYDGQVINHLEGIKDVPLDVTVGRHRKKRSIDANSYYWVLISKISEVIGASKPFIHNMQPRKYGQVEMFDGQIAYTMLPDTEDTRNRIDEMDECHFAPTSMTRTGKDGVTYRAYKLMKGSHLYDSKEMSALINGTVSDAKELGIETLPPDELERMVNSWHPKS